MVSKGPGRGTRQTKGGPSQPSPVVSAGPKGAQPDQEDEQPFCEATTLFKAIAKSRSLQSVHYSGNSLNRGSIAKIKEILRADDNRPFNTAKSNLSGGLDDQENGLEALLGHLGQDPDVIRTQMMKANTLIAKRSDQNNQ